MHQHPVQLWASSSASPRRHVQRCGGEERSHRVVDHHGDRLDLAVRLRVPRRRPLRHHLQHPRQQLLLVPVPLGHEEPDGVPVGGEVEDGVVDEVERLLARLLARVVVPPLAQQHQVRRQVPWLPTHQDTKASGMLSLKRTKHPREADRNDSTRVGCLWSRKHALRPRKHALKHDSNDSTREG